MFVNSIIIDCLGELDAIGALEPVVEDGLTVALSVTELGCRAAAGID
jgi:hypothetical protein